MIYGTPFSSSGRDAFEFEASGSVTEEGKGGDEPDAMSIDPEWPVCFHCNSIRGKVDNDHAFCTRCENTVCIDPKTEYPPEKECNGGDWKDLYDDDNKYVRSEFLCCDCDQDEKSQSRKK